VNSGIERSSAICTTGEGRLGVQAEQSTPVGGGQGQQAATPTTIMPVRVAAAMRTPLIGGV